MKKRNKSSSQWAFIEHLMKRKESQTIPYLNDVCLCVFVCVFLCSAVDMIKQKQVELSEEAEELNRAMEEMKLVDEEHKSRYVNKHLGHKLCSFPFCSCENRMNSFGPKFVT